MEKQLRALLTLLHQTGIRARLIEDDVSYISIQYTGDSFAVTLDDSGAQRSDCYTLYGGSRPDQSRILALLYSGHDIVQYLLTW